MCYFGKHQLPKKHCSEQLVYHILISATPSVALDEAALSLAQLDDAW